jgi:hypothetical protein
MRSPRLPERRSRPAPYRLKTSAVPWPICRFAGTSVICDKTAEAGLFPVMRIETMGLFTKDIKTMDDLFVHQLRTFVTPRNNS